MDIVGMSIATFAGGLLVVASLVGLPGLEASTSTRFCLAVLHAVVGAAYVLTLRFSVPQTARRAVSGTRNHAVAA